MSGMDNTLTPSAPTDPGPVVSWTRSPNPAPLGQAGDVVCVKAEDDEAVTRHVITEAEAEACSLQLPTVEPGRTFYFWIERP